MSTGTAALPPPTPTVEFRGTMTDRLCQAGLGAGALAAVLLIIAGLGNDRTVVSQSFGGVPIVLTSASLITLGAIIAAALLVCALLPYVAARYVGIGLLGLAAAIYGSIVVFARADERFTIGREYEFGPAGRWLAVAYGITCVAIVMSLIGSPRVGRPAQLTTNGDPATGTSGYSITGFVLSLCAIVTAALTATLGVAFSIAGMEDHTRSSGARGGRGLAIAGLVVGIVFLAFAALIMTIMIATADPTVNDETAQSLVALATR